MKLLHQNKNLKNFLPFFERIGKMGFDRGSFPACDRYDPGIAFRQEIQRKRNLSLYRILPLGSIWCTDFHALVLDLQ